MFGCRPWRLNNNSKIGVGGVTRKAESAYDTQRDLGVNTPHWPKG